MFNLFGSKKQHKLFIDFPPTGRVGGVDTFMFNLRSYLDEVDFPYTTDFDQAKHIFFPINYGVSRLEQIKARGGKIIQRLDGIYYPEKHGDKHHEINNLIEEIYHNYADHIVFQSDYSRKQCVGVFGEPRRASHSIIVNGVNSDIFYPLAEASREEQRRPDKFKLITTGNFRNLDMLEPLVIALDQLESEGSAEFELHIVGPVPNQELKPYLERSYIVNHGSKAIAEVAQLLRESHIFVYSHLNPPCPNSVLEAVATGLPVVGFASGAMAELLYFNTELLAEVNGEVYQRYSDFRPERLAEKIAQAMADYDKHRDLATAQTNLYNFTTTGARYIEVFNLVTDPTKHDQKN